MMTERAKQKEAEVEALKRSMQSGMGQAMREQAVLREEMQYHYRLGNFEVPTSRLSYFSEAATYIALLCVLGSDLLLEMPLICNWPVMNHKAGHSGLVPVKCG
jgi:hypothetical protein